MRVTTDQTKEYWVNYNQVVAVKRLDKGCKVYLTSSYEIEVDQDYDMIVEYLHAKNNPPMVAPPPPLEY